MVTSLYPTEVRLATDETERLKLEFLNSGSNVIRAHSIGRRSSANFSSKASLLQQGIPTPDHGGQTAQDRPEVLAAPTMIELRYQRLRRAPGSLI